MVRLACRSAVICLTACIAAGVFAQPRVFRCVDAKGRVTYTQTGCDASAEQRRLGERAQPPAAPPAPEERSKAPSRAPSADAPAPGAQPAMQPAPIRRGTGADVLPAPEPARPAGTARPRAGDSTQTELEAPDHRPAGAR